MGFNRLVSRTSWVPVMALCLGACNATIWFNLAVLGITVGIFFATLSLGRIRTGATRSGAATQSRRPS